MLRSWFAVACAGALWAGLSFGQDPLDKKDADTKAKSPKEDNTKDKVPGTKVKPPPGGVILLVDEFKDAFKLLPKGVWMSFDKYQELQGRIEQLEKQLKPGKRAAHACKLAGKLEGDVIALKAEFHFTTDVPRSTVFLGLQGAYFTDEGDLDRTIPQLDVVEDGYVVKVEKEGVHQLNLSLKVPVGLKRSTAVGGGAERAFELGLPGAAITTLTLELTPGVREIRWNDAIEKQRASNRWELALGKIRSVTVSWKEPASIPGQGPLLAADTQVEVKIDETNALVTAEMTLEDLRAQTSEWRFLAPTNARVQVKSPGNLAFDLIPPDAKTPHFTLKLKEPIAERLILSVQALYPRPFSGPRLPIGPFVLLGAYRQQGTIGVQASPEATRGQRLVFHRHGETYQRDVPKATSEQLVAATFQFWNTPIKAGVAQAPLEIELKAEKALAETAVEYTLQIRPGAEAWLIEAKVRLQIKTPPGGIDSIELQLPRARAFGAPLMAVTSALAFPAAVPWPALESAQSLPVAQPLDFFLEEAGNVEMSAPDSQRRVRLRLNRMPKRDINLVLSGKYFLPGSHSPAELELVRPVGTLDRGAKIIARTDEQVEFLAGSSSGETRVEHGPLVSLYEQTPRNISVAWRPHRPDFVDNSVVDINILQHEAMIRHALTLDMPPAARSETTRQIRLRVPATVSRFSVAAGGRLLSHDSQRGLALVAPIGERDGKAEFVLEYAFGLPDADIGSKEAREFSIPLVAIADVTRRTVKARIWTEPGAIPRLSGASAQLWHERGNEVVAERDSLPALVVQSSGLDVPLSLHMGNRGAVHLADLLCERGLIQVMVHEDGTQAYRVRYVVHKFNTRQLVMALPAPASACLTNLSIDQKKSPWNVVDSDSKRISIPIEPSLYSRPVLFEVEYKLPAPPAERQRSYQTVVAAPVFQANAFLGGVRWQIGLPGNWVAAAGHGVPDWQWGWHGWLFAPEPSVTSADLEGWLLGRQSPDSLAPVSLALWESGRTEVVVFHLPRQIWLLLCSGVLLGVGLLLFLSPIPLTWFWVLLSMLLAAVISAMWLWPSWIGPLVMGCQPGALVLGIVLVVQWMVKESYRRQVVFMPGFTRAKSSSSLDRSGGSGRRPRPISTVDEPAAPAGSPATGAS